MTLFWAGPGTRPAHAGLGPGQLEAFECWRAHTGARPSAARHAGQHFPASSVASVPSSLLSSRVPAEVATGSGNEARPKRYRWPEHSPLQPGDRGQGLGLSSPPAPQNHPTRLLILQKLCKCSLKPSPRLSSLSPGPRGSPSLPTARACVPASQTVWGQEKPGAGAKSTCAFHSRSQPLRVGMRPGMYAVRAGGRFLWTGEDRGPGGKLANTTSCGHSPEGRLLRETNPRTPRDSVGIPAVQTL